MEPYYIQISQNDEDIIITIKKKTILEITDSIKDDFDVIKIIHEDVFFDHIISFMDQDTIEGITVRSIEYTLEQPGDFLDVPDYSEDK